MTIIAWTGGSKPEKLLATQIEERRIRKAIFRSNMANVVSYWGDYRGLCTSVYEQARIQYGRARYDAHATYRERTK